MKRISKILILFPTVLGFVAFAAGLPAAGSPVMGESGEEWSATVPAGDTTYAKLAQLEEAGLLPKGLSRTPLTRMEVAGHILQARKKFKQLILVQADDMPPPPADDSVTAAPASSSENTQAPAPVASLPTPTPTPEDPAALIKAAENLHSLQEAYDYELKTIQDKKKSFQEHVAKVDATQYELMKRLDGIIEYPTIAWHGLGRAFGLSQQYFGDSGMLPSLRSSVRKANGFLDFEPSGSVDKQVRWDALIRYQTAFESNSNVGIDLILVRRASMEFNPPWFSVTLGDFDESYTPLTLWNRDNLDLRYKPEMIGRQDDFQKYESFLNQEPNWPFRGLKMGTDILWPDSNILERFKIYGMVNMIRSGFNETASGGSYYGPTDFTDWIFGGNSEIKLKRWYLGGVSVQLALDAYGLMLDEPLYSNQPYSPYAPFNPATWAHQYTISSLKPSLDVGLGSDAGFGGTLEGAFSAYVDDKRDSSKNTSDYAILGGPYFRFHHSKVTFNYLNVGPNYFSPLAQTRQDNITGLSPALLNGNPTADFFSAPLRNQFFLSNVPRPSGIFSFYDRTQDNTFPYGFATPNRDGFGLDLDVKALEKDTLKILGSVYFVKEISDNLVVNPAATNYVAVDAVPGALTPVRNFTYVNVGPSFNLGPSLGLAGDLEIGVNGRYEQTTSAIGTLTSTWILGGVRAGIFSWWEAAASFGTQQLNGSEAGYGGTTLARYSYTFDNRDLLVGGYSVFNINGSWQSWRVSSTFKMTKNSNLYFDYDMTWGNALPYVRTSLPGTLNNQFMELTYEIQF